MKVVIEFYRRDVITITDAARPALYSGVIDAETINGGNYDHEGARQ